MVVQIEHGITGQTLTPALLDANGNAAAGLVTTVAPFEIGSGTYGWEGSWPADHEGFLKFTDGSGRISSVPINLDDTMTASSIWAFDDRTLTTSVAQVAAGVAAGTVTCQRGDTLTANLTALGSLVGRTKLWLTVKRSLDDADAAAVLQVLETTGLTILNGAAGTAGQGSVVVTDQATGALTLTVVPVASAQLAPGSYRYDVQILTASGVTTKGTGVFRVVGDVTRATT